MKSLALSLVVLLAGAAAVAVARSHRQSQREWEALVREADRLDAEVEAVQLRNAARRSDQPVFTVKR